MAENLLEVDDRVYELHAEVCRVLANPVRLRILDVLRGGAKSPAELADAIDVSKTNLSQHLRTMRVRGLVRRRRTGNSVVYTVTDARLFDACATLRSLVREQLRAGGELARRGFGSSPPAPTERSDAPASDEG